MARENEGESAWPLACQVWGMTLNAVRSSLMNLSRSFSFACLPLFAFVALAACTASPVAVDAGSDAPAVDSAPMADAVLAPDAPAMCDQSSCGDLESGCLACAAPRCDAEIRRCQANTECVALNECFGDCAEGDCGCPAAHPAGVEDRDAVFNCLVCVHCQEACGGGPSC